MGFSLKHKLFASLLLIGLAAVSMTSYLGYTRAKTALESSIFNHLTSVREARADQIESYFNSIGREAEVLAATRMALEASRQFRSAIQKIDRLPPDPKIHAELARFYEESYFPKLRESLGIRPVLKEYLPVTEGAYHLQDDYIIKNPFPLGKRQLLDQADEKDDYNATHAIYHPLFRHFIDTLGFYDLLIIDPETGQVIYSVMKEPDFGTNLLRGPYRNSSLAAAVTKCMARGPQGGVCAQDFAPYAPSFGIPAAFLAVPVVDQGKIIAIFALQISMDEIDRVMTANRGWERNGLGKTGETYLVGKDHLLRSSSRFFIDDRENYFKALTEMNVSPQRIEAIRRYGTPILQQEVKTKAADTALAGVEGLSIIKDYRGIPVLSSYKLCSVLGMNWALLAEIDVAEAFAPVVQLRRELVLLSAAVLLIVLLGAGWLTSVLLRPIHALTVGAVKMAAGDRSVHIPVQSKDELGRLTDSFNTMVSCIREQTEVIEQKNRDNEALLLNILPGPIADRLRGGEEKIADHFAEVSVLFADIVGFTEISSKLPPNDVVELLNGLFTRFDTAAHELGIEKIKTIGDSYMAVCGMTNAHKDHAARIMNMAVRLIHISREHSLQHKVTVRLRIGVNSGPVVAGVIGSDKFIYDLWGDTVNLASRMESHGTPDMIQVTRAVYEKLKNQFPFEPRGPIEVRGKGLLETWILKV
jgi:class 3 adenylate cyclase/HAMP domain-containing protein